ncbi:hypothetical protein GJ496_012045 [Pomphorhynchus laevis]|nr:hypothetical protein GJ496_012045 [Pomphorhynchus laevis]
MLIRALRGITSTPIEISTEAVGITPTEAVGVKVKLTFLFGCLQKQLVIIGTEMDMLSKNLTLPNNSIRNDYEDYKYKLGKGVALTHAADYLSERSPLLAKRYIGRPAMYGHGLSGYYGGRIAGLGEKYGLMHGASYGYPRYGGIGARYGSMHKGSFGYPLSGSLGEIYGSVHRSYGYPRYGGLGGGYGSMYKGAYGYPRYGVAWVEDMDQYIKELMGIRVAFTIICIVLIQIQCMVTVIVIISACMELDHELANFMYRTSISAFELGFQVAHGLLQNYICFHTIKI